MLGARYRAPRSHSPIFGSALLYGKEFLHTADQYVRLFDPALREVAQVAAPLLATSGNPIAASALASVAQAADGYSQLRSALEKS